MFQTQCTCPPTAGLSFEEIVIALDLGGRHPKNCCDEQGYICPKLDKILREAHKKKYYYSRTKQPDVLPTTSKKNRILRKKKLHV